MLDRDVGERVARLLPLRGLVRLEASFRAARAWVREPLVGALQTASGARAGTVSGPAALALAQTLGMARHPCVRVTSRWPGQTTCPTGARRCLGDHPEVAVTRGYAALGQGAGSRAGRSKVHVDPGCRTLARAGELVSCPLPWSTQGRMCRVCGTGRFRLLQTVHAGSNVHELMVDDREILAARSRLTGWVGRLGRRLRSAELLTLAHALDSLTHPLFVNARVHPM